jgi:hypothetical protein
VSVRTALFVLGYITAAAYVVGGALGAWWPGHWDDAPASDQVIWGVLLVGGGILVLIGVRLIERSPRWGAILVSVGAVAGALVLFWTLVVPLAAGALAVLSVVYGRRLAELPSSASETRA